ncbi:MAG: hypothetical protein AB7V39_09165, partial [Nitrospiraceae bacterium]
QRGRSKVHGAMSKERHARARRRDGEPAVLQDEVYSILTRPPRARRDGLFSRVHRVSERRENKAW